MITKSTSQLKKILNIYYKYLPKNTFPYIPFIIGGFFQSLAWVSGPLFLNNFTLLPRMLILFMFAMGEYLFMSPAMNTSIEVLGMKEAQLVIQYNITTLIVFIFVNTFLFKKNFEKKYILAFFFAGLAIYYANN
jgi:uncharacterized protein (DUF486 family)